MEPSLSAVATAFGTAAAVIFYSRFYLQWLVSEMKKRSVVPVAFWYMSATGSFMLLLYGVLVQSPIGVLSHSFNMLIYMRNLVHIWREKGVLTWWRSWIAHGLVIAVGSFAVISLGVTWLREYDITRAASPEVARQTWFWIGVGVVGQGLFGCRFLIQWLATEAQKKSVIPVAFWYLSLAAATLLLASHLQRREWVFAAGVASTLLIYARNLWLIHRGTPPVTEE